MKARDRQACLRPGGPKFTPLHLSKQPADFDSVLREQPADPLRPDGGTISIERIRDLIPHAGSMCLLERVVRYDDTSIDCETRSHLDANNPLRRNGRLSCLCGIEYAAQAMALHGALGSNPELAEASSTPGNHGDGPRHGFLASVRDTRASQSDLDAVADTLKVKARLEFGDASRVIYSFRLLAGEQELLSGRAAVVLG